ncbi:MAG: hypothetical protein KGO96_11280 [Elusimicrobia bacterium]|nr:hypothetical protein [Elusimicrobiota bacterium]MDE2426474.1 hypothetical protein [Elusimicrobiota bacterium]
MIFQFLLVGTALAGGLSTEHHSPVKPLAQTAPAQAQREALLAELWQRRILSPESRRWTQEDLALLERVRAAERRGAISVLQRRTVGPLGVMAVQYKAPGSDEAELRLTREGYQRWYFFESEDAISYFESKGVKTALVFHLEDLDGHRLFDDSGLLTQEGEAVYARGLADQPAWWKTPSDGKVFGTRRPPEPRSAAGILDAVAVGPEHAALTDWIYRSSWRMHYRPKLLIRRLGRLNIIEEHDPRHRGRPRYLAVVRGEADEPAARRELTRRLGFLGPFDREHLVTRRQKLASIRAGIRRLQAGEASVRLRLDSAAVKRRLDGDLKGALAAVYVLLGPAPRPPPPTASSGQFDSGASGSQGDKGGADAAAPGGPEATGAPAGSSGAQPQPSASPQLATPTAN